MADKTKAAKADQTTQTPGLDPQEGSSGEAALPPDSAPTGGEAEASTPPPPDLDLKDGAGGSTGLVPVVNVEGFIDDLPIAEARKLVKAAHGTETAAAPLVPRFASAIDLKVAGRL